MTCYIKHLVWEHKNLYSVPRAYVRAGHGSACCNPALGESGNDEL